MLPPFLAFDLPARHYIDLLASFEILHGSEARAQVMDLRLDSLEPSGSASSCRSRSVNLAPDLFNVKDPWDKQVRLTERKGDILVEKHSGLSGI